MGSRQRACGEASCQLSRRKKTQAQWRQRNSEYFLRRRLAVRAAAARAIDEAVEDPRKLRQDVRRPEPLWVPAVLRAIPWQLAQDELGVVTTDFLAVTARELVAAVQDQRTGNGFA